MLGAAVVPKQDVALLPAVAVGIGRMRCQRVQVFEQWLALLDGPAFKMVDTLLVDVQGFPASIRMREHDRLYRPLDARQFLLAQRLAAFHHLGAGAEQAVKGFQWLQRGLQAFREVFVNRVHVGEHGVATVLRRQLATQHGRARRHPQKSLVGVPLLRSVFGFRTGTVGLDVGDCEDIRVARWGVAAGEPCQGQLAKATREREMLVVVQPLFAEQQNTALPQQLPHLANAFVRNLLAAFEVDTHDFGAQSPGDGTCLKLGT